MSSLSTGIRSATVFGDLRNTLFGMKKHDKIDGIKNMYTQLQRNFHQPLQLKRLLIGDVTQNQQIPINWKGVPSVIETLISYNACDNRITSDSFD